MSYPDMDIVNRLFLELSQFTTATTAKELALQHENERLRLALRYLSELGGGNSEGNYYAKAALR
jgi:hypothetical protein